VNNLELLDSIGNAICPLCGSAICIVTDCENSTHKNFKELQIKLNLEYYGK